MKLLILVILIIFYSPTTIFSYKKDKTNKEIKTIEAKNETKVIEIKKEAKNETKKFEYYCCFCGMGKLENLYSRELISYYMNLGVEKFVFGDNNIKGTEKLSDVLQDYISNGTVDILEIFGSDIGQAEFYGKMYNKYKDRCEWLSFFDFDEYLVMHFEKGKNIPLKEYLSNSIFDKCEAIEFNWLMYGDNGLVHYENKSSIERFTEPDFGNNANKYVKSIIRGNLTKTVFIPGKTHHQPSRDLNVCDSMGNIPDYYPDCIVPPKYEYAYLMHFNTRTAEEYANKIKRGYPGNHFENVDERIKLFFSLNKFTREKLKVFEEKFNKTFLSYHNR